MLISSTIAGPGRTRTLPGALRPPAPQRSGRIERDDWDVRHLRNVLVDHGERVRFDFGAFMAKRNDVAAVKWLLDHGADPNAHWSHWDADVTPLHLAARGGHAEIVRLLLGAGADRRVRDSKHDSDAIGWAEFFRRREIVRILEAHAAGP